MKTSRLVLALTLPVFFCTSLLLAQDVVGKVVGVIDGDTIEVLHGGSSDRVRLAGIDCPEENQPFGSKAKQATSYLAFAEQVTLHVSGKDKYNRTLAEVILPDGRSLNKELVREGMAWWYRQYSSDPELERLEAEARGRRIGLWRDPRPVAPWEWRHGGAKPSTEDVLAVPRVAEGSQATAATPQSQTVYVTRTGTKYHRAGCRYLSRSAIPMSLKEAKARYTPCSVCNPPSGDEPMTGQVAPQSSYTEPVPGGTTVKPPETTSLGATQTQSGETTKSGQTIYVGPRGGRYHYSKSGKKVYERRKR
jgi:endonuclease YncB( thermonuclease family)